MNQKTFFIIINLVLGSILLYSYYRGVTNNPDIAPKLWGGVPVYLTKYMVSSMFLGAIGYFFFTYYILFEVNHETILVLDATTGQNALNQVEEFKKISNLTGLIITKLDTSAKGGILLAICKKFGLPIVAVGMGEKESDLHSFNSVQFSKMLVQN